MIASKQVFIFILNTEVSLQIDESAVDDILSLLLSKTDSLIESTHVPK